MDTAELAMRIILTHDTLGKRQQSRITTDHDPAWRLACFIDCGLVKPDGVTDKGLAKLNDLARELGVF